MFLKDQPKRPDENTSWWKTVPGQLAVLVIVGGAIIILLGLAGVVGPDSM